MFTPEDFKKAQDIVQCIIQVAFSPKYIGDFLETVAGIESTDELEWDMERMHMSGSIFRLTVRNSDFNERDIYVDSTAVYQWFSKINPESVRNICMPSYFNN